MRPLRYPIARPLGFLLLYLLPRIGSLVGRQSERRAFSQFSYSGITCIVAVPGTVGIVTGAGAVCRAVGVGVVVGAGAVFAMASGMLETARHWSGAAGAG